MHLRCLLCDTFQEIGHVARSVEFAGQCNEISSFAEGEIVPEIALGIHFERRYPLVSKGRLVPKVMSLLPYGIVSQTVQVVCDAYLFGFVDIHSA